MVDWGRLLSDCTFTGTAGSNPVLSVFYLIYFINIHLQGISNLFLSLLELAVNSPQQSTHVLITFKIGLLLHIPVTDSLIIDYNNERFSISRIKSTVKSSRVVM